MGSVPPVEMVVPETCAGHPEMAERWQSASFVGRRRKCLERVYAALWCCGDWVMQGMRLCALWCCDRVMQGMRLCALWCCGDWVMHGMHLCALWCCGDWVMQGMRLCTLWCCGDRVMC